MYSAWDKMIKFCVLVIVSSCISNDNNNRYIGKLDRRCREEMVGRAWYTCELGQSGYLQVLFQQIFVQYLQ